MQHTLYGDLLSWYYVQEIRLPDTSIFFVFNLPFLILFRYFILKFRFHPFKGKTKVAKNTQDPCWNQEICFVWCYPSLAQTLVIQLLMHEHLQWKCMAEYELHFNEIAFKGNPLIVVGVFVGKARRF